MNLQLQLQLLQKSGHNRAAFDCGLQAVNDFLAQQARRQMEQRVNRTWVLLDADVASAEAQPIAAYFTLTQSTVTRAELPSEKSLSQYPMYPLPVIKLAWLGVAKEYQRSPLRIGETILLEALHMAGDIVLRTGLGIAVITDPLTTQSDRFFRKYGFQPMGRMFRKRQTLFLPIDSVLALKNQV